MFKLILGAFIGSLVTYNVILQNDDYRSTFESVNDWTLETMDGALEEDGFVTKGLDSAQEMINNYNKE